MSNDLETVNITLAVVMKGSAKDLQKILDTINANNNIFLVYKKTGGRLKIIED